MTTASTSTVVDHTSDAGFRAWVAEIITQLLAVGLTQTADTGQINTATVTRPGTNTAGGYTIWSFNDTLQATRPIYLKLEFGTAGSATIPQMWITMGQGSNGSGTLTGTLTTKVVVCNTSTIASTATSYTSRFVYNATYGFLGFVWKIGATGSANLAPGGLFTTRSNDTSGAATGDAAVIVTNSYSTSGTPNQIPMVQGYSWLSSALVPSTVSVANCGAALVWPYKPLSSTYSGNQQVIPAFLATPAFTFSNTWGICCLSEIAIGSTFTAATVGVTALTYLSVGGATGNAYMAYDGGGSAFGLTGTPSVGMYMLWQ